MPSTSTKVSKHPPSIPGTSPASDPSSSSRASLRPRVPASNSSWPPRSSAFLVFEHSFSLTSLIRYNAYTAAASRASAAASTAVYGDSQYQASKSASSVYSQASVTATSAYNEASASASSAYATASVFANRKMDDSKDYIYSTWYA